MSATNTGVAPAREGIRVLALDGGGIRGLSSLVLLRELMQRISARVNSFVPLSPCDYFDLIIGTGTGGLSALFLGRMHMTVDEAIEAYKQMGQEGLKKSTVSLLQHMRSNDSLFDGASMTSVIGDIVEKHVGDRDAALYEPPHSIGTAGRSCRTAVLATSSGNASDPPHLFRSYSTSHHASTHESIHGVARAATATVGIFSSISLGFPSINYIDAGVAGYNNPAQEALNEVERVWPGEKINCLVSIGTGLQNIVRVGETLEGAMQVVRRLMEDCEKVHDRLTRSDLPYYRFNVTTGLDAAGITEWDEETSGVITAVTLGYARKGDVEKIMNHCVSQLVGNTKPTRGALAEKIYAWLGAPDCSVNYNAAYEKLEEGTCTWFTDGRKFAAWRRTSRSCFCIYGKPGCGKTILCSSVIAHVANVCARAKSRAYAYFFFDGRDAQKKFLIHDNLIRSLIQQFTRQFDALPDVLVKGYDDGLQQLSTRGLEDILQRIIDGYTDAFIIIDSIDECTERAKLMNWIANIYLSKANNLHLLVTSRPEADIMDALQSLATSSISIEEESIKSDIKKYIDVKIKGGRLWRWPAPVRSRVRGELMKRTQGMFRWLALQLDELELCLDEDELYTQLENLPKYLDETYSRILIGIPKQRRARAKVFLQWTAFSVNPPTLEELVEAGAMEPHPEHVLKYNPGRKFKRRDVLSACGCLIIESEGVVKLAHFSVREYLLSDHINQGAAEYFSINEKCSHLFMAETSLAYLLRFDSLLGLGGETLAGAPLALYAARHWVSHVGSGGGDGEHGVQKLIMTFFKSESPLAYWIRIWDSENPLHANTSIKAAEPLYYASLLGFTGVARQLLQKGASVNGQGSSSHIALEGSPHVRYGNALQAACYGGHTEMVKLLLESGAEINILGGEHGCALQAAAYNGNAAMVDLLLDRGAVVNMQGGKSGSALLAAVKNKHIDIATLLVRRDMSLLQDAAFRGDQDIIQLLLELGAEVNVQGGKFGSPLQAASLKGHLEIVKLLLEKNADVNTQGGLGGNALMVASLQGHKDIVELLLQNHADVNAPVRDHSGILSESLKSNSTLQGLQWKEADVNVKGYYIYPLQAASHKGHTKIVNMLLNYGADVNAKGGAYGNAFQAALDRKHHDIIVILLNYGAIPPSSRQRNIVFFLFLLLLPFCLFSFIKDVPYSRHIPFT